MSELKISADTSEVKKSILSISKQLKDLKGSKVSIFTQEDKKFLKSEFKREVAAIKSKLKENRDEISSMVKEQKKLVKGSEEELKIREQLIKAYKVQAKLGKELGDVTKASKGGIPGGGGGGLMDKMLSGLGTFAAAIPKLLGAGALATGAFAVLKGIQATDQYVQGTPGRVRAKGLGIGEDDFGSPEALARVGLTEQEMIERRSQATAMLGRKAGSQDNEMRKAAFERAFGLEGGKMTGIAGQLRASMGGEGANEAQLKLQASVFAAGIEDAIGPYLDAATSLLADINENGMTNTDEMIKLLAQMTKDGERTPEAMAKAFAGIDNAVRGAKGEQSAFIQTAFARAGIGGGTIGGTKFSMASGGLQGLNRKELEKRGYNKQLLDNMEQSGMFSGMQKRTGAIMDEFKRSAGMGTGQKIGDIKDTDTMAAMGNLAEKVLQLKDGTGFDVLMMMEKVQSKQMTQKQFDDAFKKSQEDKDPAVERLDKINTSLAGQTEILTNINTNLMEALGKKGVVTRNEAVKLENEAIVGATNLAGAVNDTGAVQKTGNFLTRSAKYINSGSLGGDIYDQTMGRWDKRKIDNMTSDDAIVNLAKERYRKGEAFKGAGSEDEVEARVRKSLESSRLAKDIGKEVATALKESPIVNKNINNTKVQMPDGKITERTNK